ncbi:heme-binding protein [Desulfobulbus alkaliphilus]|uniref:heme-binding protein n=1 Tax=Desulfobulbus alkaliphilus TaxID=869814 RepID=UPI0035322A7A
MVRGTLPIVVTKRTAACRGHWVVGLMMPASYTPETLPVPEDPNVTFRHVPVR